MSQIRECETPLLYEVVDLERFTAEATGLPQVTRFAAVGNRHMARWFHPAARTRETPSVDRREARPPQSGDCSPGFLKHWHIVGCRLDVIARRSVARFIVKATRMGMRRSPWWGGAHLWHWWLYSDDALLVSAYDWCGDPVQIDCGLEEWAAGLERDGVLEAATTESVH